MCCCWGCRLAGQDQPGQASARTGKQRGAGDRSCARTWVGGRGRPGHHSVVAGGGAVPWRVHGLVGVGQGCHWPGPVAWARRGLARLGTAQQRLGFIVYGVSNVLCICKSRVCMCLGGVCRVGISAAGWADEMRLLHRDSRRRLCAAMARQRRGPALDALWPAVASAAFSLSTLLGACALHRCCK